MTPDSGLSFYSALTKRLEPFRPLVSGKATMYNCGPTVYSHPHIGNFRSFIFADLLRHQIHGLTLTSTIVQLRYIGGKR